MVVYGVAFFKSEMEGKYPQGFQKGKSGMGKDDD
jgi:hypothetical protein